MTVTGPVPADAVGHTQVHEHLLCDLGRAYFRSDLDGLLHDVDIAARELASYGALGGSCVVEVTPQDLGRDPAGLRRVSEASGVHVVMGVGLYREPFYPEWVNQTSTSDLARRFIEEIDNGAGTTGVRPGVIGEIGSHKKFVMGVEERVFRAAGRAQKARGLGLMTHTPPGAAAEQLDILEAEGADLSRVAVGHADNWLDLDYHLSILRRGAFLSFDLVGLPINPDVWRAKHVADLVRRGYGDQILLSTDICVRGRLQTWGGAGYGALIADFLPRLVENGLSQEQLTTMTVKNPVRFLSGPE